MPYAIQGTVHSRRLHLQQLNTLLMLHIQPKPATVSFQVIWRQCYGQCDSLAQDPDMKKMKYFLQQGTKKLLWLSNLLLSTTNICIDHQYLHLASSPSTVSGKKQKLRTPLILETSPWAFLRGEQCPPRGWIIWLPEVPSNPNLSMIPSKNQGPISHQKSIVNYCGSTASTNERCDVLIRKWDKNLFFPASRREYIRRH